MGEKVIDTGITEEQMREEAFRLLTPPSREPDELTIAMLCEKTGMTKRQAAYRLDNLVRIELMTKRTVSENGNEINAYKPTNGGWSKIIDYLKEV
jgi:RIO-like serine/threonine protein kinase